MYRHLCWILYTNLQERSATSPLHTSSINPTPPKLSLSIWVFWATRESRSILLKKKKEIDKLSLPLKGIFSLLFPLVWPGPPLDFTFCSFCRNEMHVCLVIVVVAIRLDLFILLGIFRLINFFWVFFCLIDFFWVLFVWSFLLGFWIFDDSEFWFL